MAGGWDIWKRRKRLQALFPISLRQTALSNLKAEESKFRGNQDMEPRKSLVIRRASACLLCAHCG